MSCVKLSQIYLKYVINLLNVIYFQKIKKFLFKFGATYVAHRKTVWRPLIYAIKSVVKTQIIKISTQNKIAGRLIKSFVMIFFYFFTINSMPEM